MKLEETTVEHIKQPVQKVTMSKGEAFAMIRSLLGHLQYDREGSFYGVLENNNNQTIVFHIELTQQ